MPTLRSRRSRIKKPLSWQKKLTWIVAVVIGFVICGFGLWWLVFKYNAYSPDKSAVKAEAENILSSVSLKGTEVYSSFTDKGCDSNTVGLRTDTNCSFEGYKLFKTNGSLSQTLKDADSQVEAAGWKRTFTSKSAEELDQILVSTQATYRNSSWSKGMSVSLGYFKDNSSQNDSGIKKLVEGGQISAPSGDEYIYGLSVGASYWGCTNDSIFKICPFPPSTAK